MVAGEGFEPSKAWGFTVPSYGFLKSPDWSHVIVVALQTV